tara:strand:- start:69 stop:761 length:693 start_codon:yes stop_codon:yes gene_type:complete
MSYHDLTIDNQNFPNFRADLNSALQALGSTLSGSTEPSPTYIGMLWYDTVNNILKMRNEGNDSWINIGYFDQNSDTFRLLDGTLLVDTSGVQTGLLGVQATNVWQTATGTTESLISPAKLKSAIDANLPTAQMTMIANASFNDATVNPVTTFFQTGFSSINRTGTGNYSLTFTTPRSSVDYMVFCTDSDGGTARVGSINSQATTGFDIDVRVISSGGTIDSKQYVGVFAP